MLRVSVVAATPGFQEVVEVELPEGSTVADAVAAARVFERYPELAGATAGIWARRCAPEALLRDGDRVELYRPLIADPKEQRRARALPKR